MSAVVPAADLEGRDVSPAAATFLPHEALQSSETPLASNDVTQENRSLDALKASAQATPSSVPSTSTANSRAVLLARIQSSIVYQYVAHYLPVIRWLPVYEPREKLVSDIIAAIAEVVVAVPEAISYANVAGLRAENGLYAAMIGPIVYSALGTSQQLVTGPTSLMSIITRSAVPNQWGGVTVQPYTDQYVRLAATLAFTVGAVQLLLHFLRAGFLVRLISHPVMLGFTSGSAILTASTQFANLLGVSKCSKPNGAACSLADAFSNIVNLGNKIRVGSPMAALVAIALLLAWKYALPKVLPRRFRVISLGGPLVLVVVSIAIMSAYQSTMAAAGIVLVDAIPGGMPPPASPFPPSATNADLSLLFIGAIPPILIGYVESISIAKAAARQCGGYDVDDGQELFAVGVSNLATAIGRGYPVTGSFSRTAVMTSAGARSPVASFLAGLLVIPVLCLAASTLSLLPKIATAAIVVTVIGRLIQLGEIIALARTDAVDFLVFAATFLITVFVDVVPGFTAGLIISWVVGLVRSFNSKSTIRIYAWTNAAASQSLPRSSTSSESSLVAAAEQHADAEGDVLPPTDSALELKPAPTLPPKLHFTLRSQSQFRRIASAVSRGWGVVEVASSADRSRIPETPDGAPSLVLSLSFEPDLLFHNSERLRAHVEEAIACYGAGLRVIVLDFARVNAVDATAAYALLALASNIRKVHKLRLAVAAATDAAVALLLRAAVARHGLTAVSGPGLASATAFEGPDGSSAAVTAAADDAAHAAEAAAEGLEAGAAVAVAGRDETSDAALLSLDITPPSSAVAGSVLIFDTMPDALAWAVDVAARAVLHTKSADIPVGAAEAFEPGVPASALHQAWARQRRQHEPFQAEGRPRVPTPTADANGSTAAGVEASTSVVDLLQQILVHGNETRRAAPVEALQPRRVWAWVQRRYFDSVRRITAVWAHMGQREPMLVPHAGARVVRGDVEDRTALLSRV